MDERKLTKLRKELTSFLDDVAGALGHPRRRHWCDAYLRGILLDGHRKSVEPMAARLKAIESGDGDYEQALQQFLNQSPWDEQGLLDALHTWIGERFGTDGFLIIDDTGFPKQGEHSVGVARQYTGTLGKVASCQVAVTVATPALRLRTADPVGHQVRVRWNVYPAPWRTCQMVNVETAGNPSGAARRTRRRIASDHVAVPSASGVGVRAASRRMRSWADAS